MFNKKEYEKRYYQEHKEVCLVRSRKWYQGHKERVKLATRRRRRRFRVKALKLLGSKCFFCGQRKAGRLVFHKKDGKPHRRDRVMYLVLKNPEGFVLLCRFPCHKGVHWLMRVFDMAWEEVIEKLV